MPVRGTPILDHTRFLTHAKTVGELIDLLSAYPEDMAVFVTSNFGDHGRTEQALHVQEVVPGLLAESAYSDSGLSVCTTVGEGGFDEDGNEADPDAVQVLLLRGGS